MEAKISFGIIVLNGEPFTRYCIRALYPHAHQIIVAEGACFGARNVATPDGHSRDGTLQMLKEVKLKEDPDNKIIIVTAEDEGHANGFWPGEKHEQSQAYAKRATGNYLWQVDIDEFYKEEDIVEIKNILTINPQITAVSFKQLQFWGGFDYIVDGWYLRRGAEEFHRLFKWGRGYTYSTHRPPTVLNEKGIDQRKIFWLGAKEMTRRGIHLYHYSFVFPKQVKEKAEYYKEAEWSKRKQAEWWANNVFIKLEDPFRVFSVLTKVSWLQRFNGVHPAIINALIHDIKRGTLNNEIRHTDDIELLLKSPTYKLKILYYKLLNPIEFHLSRYYKSIKRKFKCLL